jgi:hypothetical protein
MAGGVRVTSGYAVGPTETVVFTSPSINGDPVAYQISPWPTGSAT